MKNPVTLWAIGTAIVVTLDEIGQGRAPRPRAYVALAAIFVALGLAAEPLPDLAGPLALLVFVVTLFRRKHALAVFGGIK